MRNSKVDIINDAYSKLRISGLTVLPSPEDLELALSRLENMMSEFDSSGLQLNYNFEDDPDPNSLSNIPSFAYDGISGSLALRLSPDFNKIIPPSLVASVSASMGAISGRVAKDKLRKISYPSRMPVGSGNNRFNRWSKFYYSCDLPPVESIQMLVGDVNNYIYSFESYLDDSEDIDTFTIEVSPGLTLVSSGVVGDTVNFRIQAVNPLWNTVKITIVTTSSREQIKVINVEVQKPVEAQ